MTNNIRWGLDNPHPFSQMKTELIWEGKYDEYGNRLIWGDNKLVMASLLKEFKETIRNQFPF
jgi:hypothetical protein